jgi:hypothetical protein
MKKEKEKRMRKRVGMRSENIRRQEKNENMKRKKKVDM